MAFLELDSASGYYRNFSWSLERNVGHVVNLFSQALAEGAEINETGRFDLDIRAIRNPQVREPQIKSLKANATSVANLSIVEGVWEDGDPKNRLIEITFDRYWDRMSMRSRRKCCRACSAPRIRLLP